MSDGMTEEQRERLRQWQAQEGLESTESLTTETPTKQEGPHGAHVLVDHLKHELMVLQQCSDGEETLVGLFYYSQAIADLEYFIKHGVSLREAEDARTRGQQGTLISRESIRFSDTE